MSENIADQFKNEEVSELEKIYERDRKEILSMEIPDFIYKDYSEDPRGYIKTKDTKETLDPQGVLQLVAASIQWQMEVHEDEVKKFENDLTAYFLWAMTDSVPNVGYEKKLVEVQKAGEIDPSNYIYCYLIYFPGLDRCEDLKELITENAEYALGYTQFVTMDCFPEGEKAILKDKEIRPKYVELLNLIIDPKHREVLNEERLRRGLTKLGEGDNFEKHGALGGGTI